MTPALEIELKWLENGKGLALPRRASEGAAGYDLCAAIPDGETLSIAPGKRALVPCGFALALPVGWEAQVRPRSGLAARHGLTVLNAPGTIDADYRGQVKVILVNFGEESFALQRGERIAQMVLAPVPATTLVAVDTLEETSRGGNGFGSTGRA